MRAPIVDISGDIATAKKIRFPARVLLLVALGAYGFCALLDHFGRLNLAIPLMALCGIIYFVVRIKKNLARFVWFWVTMAIIVAAHVPLILFIPWTTKWIPAAISTAAGTVDIYAILWIIAAVGSFMKEPSPADGFEKNEVESG